MLLCTLLSVDRVQQNPISRIVIRVQKKAEGLYGHHWNWLKFHIVDYQGHHFFFAVVKCYFHDKVYVDFPKLGRIILLCAKKFE